MKFFRLLSQACLRIHIQLIVHTRTLRKISPNCAINHPAINYPLSLSPRINSSAPHAKIPPQYTQQAEHQRRLSSSPSLSLSLALHSHTLAREFPASPARARDSPLRNASRSMFARISRSDTSLPLLLPLTFHGTRKRDASFRRLREGVT